MRWVNRVLWLAAWSFWTWLGFGLYRELPREFTRMCSLELSQFETKLGFVGESDQFATMIPGKEAASHIIRLRNVSTGGIEKELPGPHLDPLRDHFFEPFLREGLLICSSGPLKNGQGEELAVLDLNTGKWTGLGCKTVRPVFHPEFPLGLFWPMSDDHQLSVFDLRKGRRIFGWSGDKDPLGKRISCRPFFIGEHSIAIPSVRLDNKGRQSDERLEVWNLDNDAGPTHVWLSPGFTDSYAASVTFRVAWTEPGEAPVVTNVFDLDEGRMVFSQPPIEERPTEVNFSGAWEEYAFLAWDGRTIIQERSGLWEVDSGRLLWSPTPNEKIDGLDFVGRFQVRETWKLALLGWSKQFVTFGVRDLRSGQLHYRCIQPVLASEIKPMMPPPARSAYTLGERDIVYKLPAIVNWPLLALCQTILALPLVLLWAALRRRRKRRVRMASAAT